MSFFLTAILSFLLTAGILAAVVFFSKFSFVRQFMRSLDLTLLLVLFPQIRKKEDGQKNPLEEINATGQLLNILSGLKIPFVIEVAVPVIGEEIHFYLGVPRRSLNFVTKQINGLFPEAKVEPAEDYTVFNPGGMTAAAYLKTKHLGLLPFRTYLEANLDTFDPILSNFSKIAKVGEGLALQIVTQAAPKSAAKGLAAMLERLKKGGSVLGTEKITKLLDFKEALFPKTPAKTAGSAEPPPVVDQETVKAAEQKISKPLFNVNVRLIASAATQFRAEELLDSLAGSFTEFAAPLRNELKAVKVRHPKKLASEFIFRKLTGSESMILGTDELASIFHFPITSTQIPKVKGFKAKEAEPPALLPEAGVPIGESRFRNEAKKIYITDDDRRRHIYIVGQTGTGKSNLLTSMAAADIEAGKGMALIDPHGELIESVLALIPPARRDDVIVFDPSDLTRPIGLNMLEYDQSKPEQKTFIVNEMISIFDKLFDLKTTGGPMFEQYTRNALLLLMDDPTEQATLMEVPRVFTDAGYRNRLLTKCVNPIVRDFWEKEATKTGGEASLANMTPYITSKFSNFIANDYVRPIIGQPKSTLNFRKIMDEGKILLIALPKGKIGDINAGLLGMVLVGKILMSAFSRVDRSQEERRDFYLYIDEFQNFSTDSIATILSEARKYRLNLVIAHQFIGQLTEKIRDAVFGNVGSLIVFRIGADDAEFIVKQFEPIFTQNDLINIDNYHVYAKLLIGGQTAKPFNIKTLPAKKGAPEISQALREISRLTYGRGREEVESEILARLRG